MDQSRKKELLESAREAYDLIRDIVNASGNQQPYDTEELHKICTPVWDKLYCAISSVTGEEYF